jgi:hypothetical protein
MYSMANPKQPPWPFLTEEELQEPIPQQPTAVPFKATQEDIDAMASEGCYYDEYFYQGS